MELTIRQFIYKYCHDYTLQVFWYSTPKSAHLMIESINTGKCSFLNSNALYVSADTESDVYMSGVFCTSKDVMTEENMHYISETFISSMDLIGHDGIVIDEKKDIAHA